jgi:retron-type reverse transcriptase
MSKEYKIWKIPKRRGGSRTIESPNDELKAAQRESIGELQKKLKISPFAYAFQPYKSIALCAMAHVGKEWIGCIDVKDFFPSITIENFMEHSRTTDAIKTCGDSMNFEKDLRQHFHDFNDGKGCRLPQGAPGSPLLSNAYLLKADWRFAWLAYAKGVAYNRYADDLIFSGPNRDDIVKLIGVITSILKKDYDLKINKKKTKIMHRSRRQLVVGLCVNEKLNLKREYRKNLRARKHQEMLKHGKYSLETKGMMAFEEMVRNNQKTTHSSIDIISSIMIAKELSGG